MHCWDCRDEHHFHSCSWSSVSRDRHSSVCCRYSRFTLTAALQSRFWSVPRCLYKSQSRWVCVMAGCIVGKERTVVEICSRSHWFWYRSSLSLYFNEPARGGVPLWLSKLRIWHCRCCGASSVPGLGISLCCGHSQGKKKKKKAEFPLWPPGLRTRHCHCEDASSIPGLTQWVKDPALPQAAV